MITDYNLEKIQNRPIYKLSAYVFKAGNTNYDREDAADFQLAESDFYSHGNKIRVEGDGILPIGNAVSKAATLILSSSVSYEASDFVGACIELIIKAYAPDESWTVTGDYYFVQTAKKINGQINLECVDLMCKADIPYTPPSSGLPPSQRTLKKLYEDVYRQIGFPYDVSYDFPNSNFVYMRLPYGYTCRQMLGFIAMIAGGNAVVIPGFLGFEINALTESESNSLYQWQSFVDDVESIQVTGISTTVSLNIDGLELEEPYDVYSSKYAEGYVLHLENPLFRGVEKSALDLIMSGIKRRVFRNFSGTHIGYPLAEYGDFAQITHRDGTLSTYITDIEWDISGSTTFACKINGIEENGATYEGPESSASSGRKPVKLDDLGIAHGTATLAFGTAPAGTETKVLIPGLSSVKAVFVVQCFDSVNVRVDMVSNSDSTPVQTATEDGVQVTVTVPQLTTSGTRQTTWMAIGTKKSS